MDEMTKKLKSLEKETAQWKQRWEKSNTLLLDMASEKKQRDAELVSTTKQVAQLEKLCRALQTERVTLINEIKIIKTTSTTNPLEVEELHSEKSSVSFHERLCSLEEEKCGSSKVAHTSNSNSNSPMMNKKNTFILESLQDASPYQHSGVQNLSQLSNEHEGEFDSNVGTALPFKQSPPVLSVNENAVELKLPSH